MSFSYSTPIFSSPRFFYNGVPNIVSSKLFFVFFWKFSCVKTISELYKILRANFNEWRALEKRFSSMFSRKKLDYYLYYYKHCLKLSIFFNIHWLFSMFSKSQFLRFTWLLLSLSEGWFWFRIRSYSEQLYGTFPKRTKLMQWRPYFFVY